MTSPWSRSARHRTRAVFAALALCLLVAPIAAQLDVEHKASLTLRTDRTAYPAGSEVTLTADVTIDHGWHVNGNEPTLPYLIPTELTLALPTGASIVSVDYPPAQMLSFVFTDEPIAVYEGTVPIVARFTLPADAQDSLTIDATLSYQACDDNSCLRPTSRDASIDVRIGEGTATDAAASGVGTSFLGMLLLALVGGLILNAMPCVLPVLSLKIFGMVKSAEQGRRHVVMGALGTTAGILVSFWVLAGAAVAAKAAGGAVGWGVQFQQPGFVAFLAVVVVLFTLNLWGLFEIPLPQRFAQLGGQGSDGLAGHFVSGLFATLMATPCSAPFLGTAVGFALGQQAGTIFAMFTAVGLGLALPYLLLAAFPSSARLFPKPGAWMLTLRGVLGFLLGGSAVWLFFVLSAQIGPAQLAFFQLALLLLALFVWLHRRSKGGTRRLVTVLALLAAIGSIVIAAGGRGQGGATVAESTRHDWQPFDEGRALEIAAQGRPVFVDFTADWCLTCKTNEYLVLETDTVSDAFTQDDVVTMKADWTNADPEITAFLARYGRSSIPFYILYRPQQDPYVFGELLTKDRVLDALASTRAVASLD